MIYGVREVFGGFIPRVTRGTRHTDAIRSLRLHWPVDTGHQRPRLATMRGRKHFRKWHAPYYQRGLERES